MSNIEGIDTYEGALYAVKRGFLIIGLTGYTGAGCSTAREILKNKNHLPIPEYAKMLQKISPDQNDTLQKKFYNKNEYEKLKRVWEKTS